MENITLLSLKNLGKERDYDLGLRIFREMDKKGLNTTEMYKYLSYLLERYYYYNTIHDDLHDFLKSIGANVL